MLRLSENINCTPNVSGIEERVSLLLKEEKMKATREGLALDPEISWQELCSTSAPARRYQHITQH